jgi:hypothetical protein
VVPLVLILVRWLLSWFGSGQEQSISAMAAHNGGAQAQAMGPEPKQARFLHNLEEKGVPFYSLSMVKTIQGRLVAAA